jgi:hypothetical protein
MTDLTTLTETEIRALDGPALTRLAWELGLAPDDVAARGNGSLVFRIDGRYGYMLSGDWQPHLNLAQADAVFRGLRELGWATTVIHDERGGIVHTYPLPRKNPAMAWQADFYIPDEEAAAILRCAVLAAWSTQQPKETP